MMNSKGIESASDWEALLNNIPRAHFLQSADWGALKADHGWAPHRFLVSRREQPVAAALVLARKLPIFGVPVLYCPRGPLFFPSAIEGGTGEEERDLYRAVLVELEKIARRLGAVSLKIDPDFPLEKAGGEDLEPVKRGGCSAALWQEALTEAGWSKGSEIQFRNTAMLEICPEEDEQLARMKPKTRYNIRLARKKGVEVELSTLPADLETFLDIYSETGSRNGFITRSKDYYLDMTRRFTAAGKGILFVARHEGEILTGAYLTLSDDKMWYMYGASRSKKRNLMAPVLLQYAMIRWGAENGYRVYDMWGAPEVLDKSDSMYSVYRFKEGLGAEFTEQCGAFEKVFRPALNYLVDDLFPALRRTVRRIRGRG